MCTEILIWLTDVCLSPAYGHKFYSWHPSLVEWSFLHPLFLIREIKFQSFQQLLFLLIGIQ